MANPNPTPNKPKGRPKGVPNKSTATNRQFFQHFCDRNADRVQELWENIAIEEPTRALQLLWQAAEFCIPKLARQEISGPEGEKLSIVFHGVPPPGPSEP